MKKEYYRIVIPEDEAIQGKDLSHVSFVDTHDRENSYRLIGHKQILENPPKLMATLDDGAVATNVIEPLDHTLGFLIDKKTKNVFEKFNLSSSTAFYDVKLIDKEQNHFFDYYFLHHVSNMNEKIDYSRSMFYEYNILNHEEKNVSFKDDSELQKFTSENVIKSIRNRKVVLDKNTSKSDFFQLSLGEIHFYISNSLKRALEDVKTTGIEFRKVDFFDFE